MKSVAIALGLLVCVAFAHEIGSLNWDVSSGKVLNGDGETVFIYYEAVRKDSEDHSLAEGIKQYIHQKYPDATRADIDKGDYIHFAEDIFHNVPWDHVWESLEEHAQTFEHKEDAVEWLHNVIAKVKGLESKHDH